MTPEASSATGQAPNPSQLAPCPESACNQAGLQTPTPPAGFPAPSCTRTCPLTRTGTSSCPPPWCLWASPAPMQRPIFVWFLPCPSCRDSSAQIPSCTFRRRHFNEKLYEVFIPPSARAIFLQAMLQLAKALLAKGRVWFTNPRAQHNPITHGCIAHIRYPHPRLH